MYEKKIMKKFIKKSIKMNLLEDLTMLLLNFNFVMSYIIHKVLTLLSIYNFFLRK